MAKHKYIESPERMWQLFEEYRKTIEDNPIEVQDYVGKDGDEVYRKKQRPLTMEGFENYCADQEVIADLGHYFANTDKKYEDYRTICSRIRRNIRQNQIEGGMAGIYNPSITQRLNGLVEKSSANDRTEHVYKIVDATDNPRDTSTGTSSSTEEGLG